MTGLEAQVLTASVAAAYPFLALAFVVVPPLPWRPLGEVVGLRHWIGAMLIGAGVWVSVW